MKRAYSTTEREERKPFGDLQAKSARVGEKRHKETEDMDNDPDLRPLSRWW